MIRTGQAAIHFCRYMLGLDRPETQTTPAEQSCLKLHVRDKRRAIEIGVFEGATTRVLAEAMEIRGAELIGIDPFLRGRLGLSWGKLIAQTELVKARTTATVKVLEVESTEASNLLTGEFDFVFIDGDHSIQGITADWDAWSGRVTSGGILALHDTRVPEHNPLVKNYGSYQFFEKVIKIDNRYRIAEYVDSLNVMRRI